MHLAVSARTDTGRLRKGNEDNLYADANEYRGLFIVADGMGGHAAGEVASQMAVDLISSELADLNDLTAADRPIVLVRYPDGIKGKNSTGGTAW